MKAVGIDLGTTNTVVAIDEGHGPRIVPIGDEATLTPSVVSFYKDEIVVGRSARNNAENAPQDTIFSIKRLMGRSIDDPVVKQVQDKYPYAIVSAADPSDRGVRVLINGVKYTPVEISAMILRQVVEDASRALGETVTHAVITVPAYFNPAQIAATREAGERAGLIVKQIIDEPTAAAIAFGMDHPDESNYLLVFDMGGGTLDVSILQAANRLFVVRAVAGNMWLGGDDFDQEIVNFLLAWVKERYEVDVSNDKRFLMHAKYKGEQAKHVLSDESVAGEESIAEIVIPDVVPLSSGVAVGINMQIDRQQFAAKIQHYVEDGRKLIGQALAKKSLTPERISKVLLVGGATRVPLVREMVTDVFGAQKVIQAHDPMEAVALGAAILAQRLEGIECPKCKTINPEEARQCKNSTCGASLSTAPSLITGGGIWGVTARDLGISIVDEEGQRDVFAVIVPAGTRFPMTSPIGRPFRTQAHQMRIPVYEGDKPTASENEYLGLVEYELPSDMPPGTSVTVQFNYDRDRILRVRIEIQGHPDLAYETTLVRDVALPVDVPDREKELRFIIAVCEEVIKEYQEFMEDEPKALLLESIKRGKALLDKQEDDKQDAYHQAAEELKAAVSQLETASYLYVAERRMIDILSPTRAEVMGRACQSLRAAYRKHDRHLVEQLQQGLDQTFAVIQQTSPGGIGPGRDIWRTVLIGRRGKHPGEATGASQTGEKKG